MSTIKNGDYVRDTITGFEGTVTGLASYLHTEDRAQVEGTDGSGALRCLWIDVPRLERASIDGR